MDLPDNIDGDSAHRRSKNFTSKEVDLLLDLMAQYIDVIECKKSDKVTQNGKDAVWKLVEKEFNDASIEIYRDAKTLKGKYDNIKKQSKKKWAKNKDMLSTGGDPSTSASYNLNETDYKIKEMLGNTQLNGSKSVYCTDFIQSLMAEKRTHLGLALNSQTSQSQDSSEETILETVDRLSSNKEHSNQNSELKDQVNSPLTREKLARFSNKYSVSVRHSKITPATSNKQQKNAFNARKMKYMFDSKHDLLELRKQVLKEQIQLRREDHKLKVKEHEEKMRLLKLRIRNEELILKTSLVEIQHIMRKQPLFGTEFE